MKKACILYSTVFMLYFLAGVENALFAQNFLWGRSGGSDLDIGTGPIEWEAVKDIATDVNGNVYIIAPVDSSGLRIAGQPLKGFGSSDIMLASFKPDGTLRWAKMVGGENSDFCMGLGTDEKDGIYFMGTTPKVGGPVYIDTDAISPQNYQFGILVKYDTAGKFQWYRHPDADTLTNWNFVAKPIVMDVGKSGNVYWLTNLHPGSYGGGALNVTIEGMYILKYSSSGGFSYIKPDVAGGSFFGGIALTVDEKHDRFYLSGYGSSLIMGGIALKSSIYVGCFKLDGSFLWKTEDTTGWGIVNHRAAIDGGGNIYLAGRVDSKLSTLNGKLINNNAGSAFVIKMDKDGNTLWVKSAKGGTGLAVAVLNNDQVIMAGDFEDSLEWPGSGIPVYSNPPDYGYDMFITRFDANTGDVLGMDRTSSSFGYGEFPYCMAADGNGHVYIGGGMTKDMYINQSDTIKSNGGKQDWFVVKYGDMWPVTIDEKMSRHKVKIYPNPATAQIIIEGAETGSSISLFNIFGQQVRRIDAVNGKVILNISDCTTGSYLLKLINTDGSILSKKVTIQ